MTPPITALGSRYGIQGALGRSVKRASTASTWWDLNGTITSCVAAYQPKGAASYAASLTDLSGNSNNATEGGAPDWDATNGWKFGDDDYLDGGISAGSTYSMIVRFSDAVASGNYNFIAGGIDTTPVTQFVLNPINSTNRKYYFADKALTASGAVTSGVMALTPSAGYYNGGSDVTFTGATWAGGDCQIFIGQRSLNGGLDKYGSKYIQAFAIYSSELTPTQVGNLSTAMAAL